MKRTKAFSTALIGVVTAAGAACGPMPGYVSPQPRQDEAPRARSRSTVEYTESEAEQQRPERRRAPVEPTPTLAPDERPRVDAPREETPRYDDRAERRPNLAPPRYDQPAAPLPAAEPPAATRSTSDALQVVQLGNPDTYYLIDRQRGLCFLHIKGSVAPVDCARLPEAQDVRAPDPARPSAPPTPVAPPATPQPSPAPAPAPIAPPPPAAAPPTTAPPAAPSPEELTRFEESYFAIFCDRRHGAETPPKLRIEEQGLTVERYGELEAWWANDQKAWWTLTNKARRSCKGATP